VNLLTYLLTYFITVCFAFLSSDVVEAVVERRPKQDPRHGLISWIFHTMINRRQKDILRWLHLWVRRRLRHCRWL